MGLRDGPERVAFESATFLGGISCCKWCLGQKKCVCCQVCVGLNDGPDPAKEPSSQGCFSLPTPTRPIPPHSTGLFGGLALFPAGSTTTAAIPTPALCICLPVWGSRIDSPFLPSFLSHLIFFPSSSMSLQIRAGKYICAREGMDLFNDF